MLAKNFKLLTLCTILLVNSGAKGFDKLPKIHQDGLVVAREISNRNRHLRYLSTKFSKFVSEDNSCVYTEMAFVINILSNDNHDAYVNQLKADINALNQAIKSVAMYPEFFDEYVLLEIVEIKKAINEILSELDSPCMKDYIAYLNIEKKYAKRLFNAQDGIMTVKKMIDFQSDIFAICEKTYAEPQLASYLEQVKKDHNELYVLYRKISESHHGIRNKILALIELLRTQLQL